MGDGFHYQQNQEACCAYWWLEWRTNRDHPISKPITNYDKEEYANTARCSEKENTDQFEQVSIVSVPCFDGRSWLQKLPVEKHLPNEIGTGEQIEYFSTRTGTWDSSRQTWPTQKGPVENMRCVNLLWFTLALSSFDQGHARRSVHIKHDTIGNWFPTDRT